MGTRDHHIFLVSLLVLARNAAMDSTEFNAKPTIMSVVASLSWGKAPQEAVPPEGSASELAKLLKRQLNHFVVESVTGLLRT